MNLNSPALSCVRVYMLCCLLRGIKGKKLHLYVLFYSKPLLNYLIFVIIIMLRRITKKLGKGGSVKETMLKHREKIILWFVKQGTQFKL